MPAPSAADTIRILIATDSHVGYNERDPIRGDDSWKSFHEAMCLAKEQDVDMVLLAGDLFHDNKPSRKSMYQVMRSLRMNCYGEKPCELEMLSDASENFQGAFNHVNYEDPDINVAIPVFSIHGNHDDPSGEGHLCALDLLQISGLLNYYGRTPESDNISVKPVLLQKGHTKLALYGMSNVRDERLFRTFRDGKVKFFRPNVQPKDWFNLMAVHQNHHAYTDTGYLPENFLPEFLDLVVWGHEHECLIDPRLNPEMSFHVMQPGSSVATSLCPGEAVSKHVAIASITARDFKVEKFRLKTVRPFVMKEVVLSEEKQLKGLAKKENNRTQLTQYLVEVVENLIEEAKTEWLEVQEDEDDEEREVPLPLVRLRIEYSAPDGGKFDCENPQRFSNRFVGKVANVNDVVQFYRKKSGMTRKGKDDAEMPEESVIAQLSIDNVKVEKLVREFLTAQSLTILPQNSFGDAVSQYVDKDDKHAMETFVNQSLENQFKHLMVLDRDDEELQDAMDEYRAKLEEMFAAGHLKMASKKRKLRPKPDNWDSDLDGEWDAQPAARIHSEEAEDDADEVASLRSTTPAPRGRGKPAAGRGKKPAAPKKAAAPTRGGRGKKVVQEESEDEDVVMIDDDEEEEEPPPKPTRSTRAAAATRGAAATASRPPPAATKRAPPRAAALKQSKITSQLASQASTRGRKAAQELSEDEISDDDDDAFEPPPLVARPPRRRGLPMG
ncbi:Double-strand break repair protein mus-23 [Glutinoglossum americanum]|uniref:Double-strand break repair protein n=1 Tax=Glutinoglossum americanum TaxID=1670608 RepID=A0A9P8I0S7_9PEZI|nr:Double-strand break repair protein mus-23 [Glutinoglossum americanum]